MKDFALWYPRQLSNSKAFFISWVALAAAEESLVGSSLFAGIFAWHTLDILRILKAKYNFSKSQEF